VASASCAGADLLPNQRNLAAVQAAALCLINRERAAHGEQALTADARLTKAAAAHSHDMVARDYFSHVSPSGQTPLARIEASGFIPPGPVGFAVGENIAWGTLWLATPREIVRAWMESPGHRASILDRRYRYTGIGVAPAVPRSLSKGQAGAVYTQDFAAITS
jgi:uncharacterized protein YkwD